MLRESLRKRAKVKARASEALPPLSSAGSSAASTPSTSCVASPRLSGESGRASRPSSRHGGGRQRNGFSGAWKEKRDLVLRRKLEAEEKHQKEAEAATKKKEAQSLRFEQRKVLRAREEKWLSAIMAAAWASRLRAAFQSERASLHLGQTLVRAVRGREAYRCKGD